MIACIVTIKISLQYYSHQSLMYKYMYIFIVMHVCHHYKEIKTLCSKIITSAVFHNDNGTRVL